MGTLHLLTTALLLAVLCWAPDEPAHHVDHGELTQRLAQLVGPHPQIAQLLTLGYSQGQRSISALVLGRSDINLEEAIGVLLVGGLDGRRLSDASVLLGVAERLLEDEAELADALGDRVIVLVPRVSPDGGEVLLGSDGPSQAQRGNGRQDDADKDGRTDEDGPEDLDGDGMVTWMRIPDPEGEWVIDEHDPRSLRKARRDRGERPTHRVQREGRDLDGDGKINEDDLSGVEVDRNFPHRWLEHDSRSGAYPFSEPESSALGEFLLEHPGIVAVIDVGSQDTLVTLPKKDEKPQRGGWRSGFSAPLKGLLTKDHETLKELQRRLKGVSEEKVHEAKADGLADGSFLSWAYFHGGRWPIAVTPWEVPQDLPKGKEAEEEAEEKNDAESPPQGDAVEDEKAEEAKPTSDPDSPVPAAVLSWLDKERDGEGFVPWSSFDHPDLGEVEIGGFVPGLLVNPSYEVTDGLAEILTPFVSELLEMLPVVRFEDVAVERLGPDLHAISVAVVNPSPLPTASSLGAEARIQRPLRLRLDLPENAVRLHGSPQELIGRLEGAGGRHEVRWVVSAPSGTVVSLLLDAETVPDLVEEVTLP